MARTCSVQLGVRLPALQQLVLDGHGGAAALQGSGRDQAGVVALQVGEPGDGRKGQPWSNSRQQRMNKLGTGI